MIVPHRNVLSDPWFRGRGRKGKRKKSSTSSKLSLENDSLGRCSPGLPIIILYLLTSDHFRSPPTFLFEPSSSFIPLPLYTVPFFHFAYPYSNRSSFGVYVFTFAIYQDTKISLQIPSREIKKRRRRKIVSTFSTAN